MAQQGELDGASERKREASRTGLEDPTAAAGGLVSPCPRSIERGPRIVGGPLQLGVFQIGGEDLRAKLVGHESIELALDATHLAVLTHGAQQVERQHVGRPFPNRQNLRVA